MMAHAMEAFDCCCSEAAATPLAGKSGKPFAVAARRLQALLDVADVLTEMPELTEIDTIALEVVLAAARDHANEIVWWSEQTTCAEGRVQGRPHS
jgi:hypothetical protein